MPVVRGARTPQFGDRLRGYRETLLGKRNSLDQVAERLQALGFKTGKRTVSEYEHGRPPNMAILWGLCQVYRLDFVQHCMLVANELTGGLVNAAPTETPISEEATEIARAFDRGPDDLKDLIRHAVRMNETAEAQRQSSFERTADARVTARDSRERQRRSRRG